MLDLLLAVLIAFSPQGGTVFTSDGGRLRGTVLEVGSASVTVLLADGLTRKVDVTRVSRIDFADGTSWRPSAPSASPAARPAAPAAQPPPPAAILAAQPPAVTVPPVPPAPSARPATMAVPFEKLDTIFFARGGRVRCLVMEEAPEGVVVRLVDGTERRYGPGQVSRIDWSDGTHTDLAAPAGPIPVSAAAPPPAPVPQVPVAPPPAAAPAAAPPPAPPQALPQAVAPVPPIPIPAVPEPIR